MKLAKILLCLALVLAGSSAWAHGPRARVGVYVGPVWGPVWYPPLYSPYYYPPQVVVVPQPAPPPVYVEQQEAPAEVAAPAQQYWYFCPSAKAYYPYVKECPGGWQKVLPQPEK